MNDKWEPHHKRQLKSKPQANQILINYNREVHRKKDHIIERKLKSKTHTNQVSINYKLKKGK